MLWYERAFIYATYMVYILYIFTFFHISDKAPGYILLLNYFRQIFVGAMLLYISNPLRKNIEFTNFQKKLIFTSSLFLLIPIIETPTIFFENSSKITNTVKNIFHKYI